MAQRLLFYVGGFLSLCALACQVSGQQFQLTHPKLGRQHSTASLFVSYPFALGMRVEYDNR